MVEKPLQTLQLTCTVCTTNVAVVATDGVDLFALAHLEGWRCVGSVDPPTGQTGARGDVPEGDGSLRWLCRACRSAGKEVK